MEEETLFERLARERNITVEEMRANVMKYKIQAVKPAKKIGGAKAAAELGIPENTMYICRQESSKKGRLDIGFGSHTPHTALDQERLAAFA